MSEFKKFRRKGCCVDMAPWTPAFDMTGVSVGDADKANGSPKPGDMIAVRPGTPDDKWLVSADAFSAYYDTTPMDWTNGYL